MGFLESYQARVDSIQQPNAYDYLRTLGDKLVDMRLSQDELTELLSTAKRQVEVGAKYKHYKSDDMIYEVKDIVIQEVDNEPCVIYKALYGNRITFSRTVKVWLETVDFEGKLSPRFTKL